MGDGGGPVEALATGPEVDVLAPSLLEVIVQPATIKRAPTAVNGRSEASVTFRRGGE